MASDARKDRLARGKALLDVTTALTTRMAVRDAFRGNLLQQSAITTESETVFNGLALTHPRCLPPLRSAAAASHTQEPLFGWYDPKRPRYLGHLQEAAFVESGAAAVQYLLNSEWGLREHTADGAAARVLRDAYRNEAFHDDLVNGEAVLIQENHQCDPKFAETTAFSRQLLGDAGERPFEERLDDDDPCFVNRIPSYTRTRLAQMGLAHKWPLFAMVDQLLLPFVQGFHYFVMDIDLDKGLLHLYDSNKGQHQGTQLHKAVADGVRKWISVELAAEKSALGDTGVDTYFAHSRLHVLESVQKWPLIVNPPTVLPSGRRVPAPRQTNSVDCGAFAVVTMRCLAAHVPLTHTQEEVSRFWRPMLALEWKFKRLCDPMQWHQPL